MAFDPPPIQTTPAIAQVSSKDKLFNFDENADRNEQGAGKDIENDVDSEDFGERARVARSPKPLQESTLGHRKSFQKRGSRKGVEGEESSPFRVKTITIKQETPTKKPSDDWFAPMLKSSSR